MEVPLHAAWRELTLLDYLALLWPDRSREGLRDLFARGGVRSGGKPVGARRRLGEVAELTIEGPLDAIRAIHLGAPGCAGPGSIPILHEDDRFTVLAKPAGVPVVPDRGQESESCLGFLIRRELAARAAKPPEEYIRSRIVHRIDRLTSGLVIVARTAEVERRLGADFEARRVEKEYLALLAGVVAAARMTVNCPIAPGRKGRMRAEVPARAAKRGAAKGAVTRFEVVERFADTTLVRAVPFTGRTHQIRVHAWATGHPLAVDPVYGEEVPPGAREPLAGLEGLSLHAHRYTLPPDWDEPRSFTCPLPEGFRAALAALRSGARCGGDSPSL